MRNNWTSWRRCTCGAELFFAFDRESGYHYMRHGDGEALAPPMEPYYDFSDFSQEAGLLLPAKWVHWLRDVHAYQRLQTG